MSETDLDAELAAAHAVESGPDFDTLLSVTCTYEVIVLITENRDEPIALKVSTDACRNAGEVAAMVTLSAEPLPVKFIQDGSNVVAVVSNDEWPTITITGEVF